jgi:aspartyl-tRNA(Asn)/glutamyl-tRNA(Gln) amidotransferase subunit B
LLLSENWSIFVMSREETVPYPCMNIGLEIHVQLKTKCKLFSESRRAEYGAKANSALSIFDLGLPGAMPVANPEAIYQAIKIALALGSRIHKNIKFDRKHYFYPDLPAGYQITQFQNSFAYGGFIQLPSGKKIKIQSMHLETDAAKLKRRGSQTFVDFNRCGTPLLEIITDASIYSPEEAIETAKALQREIIATGAAECHMEKGQFRCDVNFSCRETVNSPMGERTEIKNVNSFKAIGDAIKYEFKRQNQGQEQRPKQQQTVGYSLETGKTKFMRFKEHYKDYCYVEAFNIPEIVIEQKDIEKISQEMPEELPSIKLQRYGKFTSVDQALVLVENEKLCRLVDCFTDQKNQSYATNLLTNAILEHARKNNLNPDDIQLDNFKNLIKLMLSGELSHGIFKKHLLDLIFTEQDLVTYLEKNKLKSLVDKKVIKEFIEEARKSEPKVFERYLAGEDKLRSVIIGKVMQLSRGKVNGKVLLEVMREILGK